MCINAICDYMHCCCCCLVTELCPTLVNPWTAAHQAPLSMGLFTQEYWSWLPFPSPRDLPDPGFEATPPTLTGRFFTTEPPGKSYPLCIFPSYFEGILLSESW